MLWIADNECDQLIDEVDSKYGGEIIVVFLEQDVECFQYNKVHSVPMLQMVES